MSKLYFRKGVLVGITDGSDLKDADVAESDKDLNAVMDAVFEVGPSRVVLSDGGKAQMVRIKTIQTDERQDI